ncbi:MAG TPA: hypothetical protein VKQ72_10480 [Aggregatilineales bacterium]|nr:hypothetical protein [Aggregatilineales bacterium]
MARHKPKTSSVSPLPGLAGQRVLDLLRNGHYEAAISGFCDTFIGNRGAPVYIRIVEDDGYTLSFESDRGYFKVFGPGRELVLQARDVVAHNLESVAPAKQLIVDRLEVELHSDQFPETQRQLDRFTLHDRVDVKSNPFGKYGAHRTCLGHPKQIRSV